MSRVVVITGGSSGIGKALVERLSRAGDTVYELSRSGADSEGVRHLSVDLTDEAQIVAALAEIGRREDHIDLLVNNAGMGISGAVETTAAADAKRLFDVDFFAAFLCSKYALPLLRPVGGRIINVSSVAAVYSIPFQAFYSAAKAAVNALTLAMANELRGSGVQVAAFMPGDVKTGFTAAREKNSDGAEQYGARLQRAVAVMEHDEQNGMAPETLAAAIDAFSRKKKMKPLKSCGFQYQLFLFLGKLLPQRLINFIVSRMYG